VLIDGYNVSMLGWPNRPIDEQRTALVKSVENMALRFGTDATIVFDGADVVGAHSLERRSTRVLFSPSGVIADDVIRAEVDRTPDGRHVVVVTNDAEIARDVRAAGANVLPSNALLAVL
jgi:predicted RNA-binding protein with PIN domain